MNSRAKELHEEAIVVDGQNGNHIMMELAKRRNRGDRSAFVATMLREFVRKGLMFP